MLGATVSFFRKMTLPLTPFQVTPMLQRICLLGHICFVQTWHLSPGFPVLAFLPLLAEMLGVFPSFKQI